MTYNQSSWGNPSVHRTLFCHPTKEGKGPVMFELTPPIHVSLEPAHQVTRHLGSKKKGHSEGVYLVHMRSGY